MSPAPIAAAGVAGIVLYATELASQVLPLAIKGVSSAIQLWNQGNERIARMIAENRDPTDSEWDELNQEIGALQALLHSDDPNDSALDPEESET